MQSRCYEAFFRLILIIYTSALALKIFAVAISKALSIPLQVPSRTPLTS
jgi:hypothetical protein